MKGSCATGGVAATACKKITIFSANGMTGLASLVQALEGGEAGEAPLAWRAKQVGNL